MTTRWCQKAPSVVAVVVIVFLLILIVSLWTAASNGAFSSQQQQRSSSSSSSNEPDNYINFRQSNNETLTPHLQNSINRWLEDINDQSSGSSNEANNDAASVHPPTQHENYPPPDLDVIKSLDLDTLVKVEYIKPTKIFAALHNDDILFYEAKYKNNSGGSATDSPADIKNHHITGHFRNKSSRIWDPHPQYEIDAFGLHLHLILNHDADFVSKEIKITHVWPNETLRKQSDQDENALLQGCFYKGTVRGDEKSHVTVSLCDGMRGHIRTSSGSYFIQPVEKYTSNHTNILHAFYRLPSVGADNENEIDKDPAETHCAVEDTKDDVFESDSATLTTHHVRQKRNAANSMSNHEYTIEVLVGVDRKMIDYHGDGINSYVLTLMSIVSSIFADASIGNLINVAVVHILIVNHDLVPDANGIGVSASRMLLEFCKFKQKYNLHHDAALLLTREQICRAANQMKCDTLGLTELGTMCKPSACAIVQDNGLSAAFTIAHELGHVLNMPHDDDPKCERFRGGGKTKQNIMSRMLDHNTHPWSWSNCSRHFVTEYLENNLGSCMLDKPKLDMIGPSMTDSKLAGEKFTDNMQCELVFGAGSKICSYMPVCSRLWCSEDDQEIEGCRTQHMPWADGTACSDNHWCQKGNCVPRNRSALMPQDGEWGEWSQYGECSVTCGGGIQSQTRACDSPAPSNGGRYCTGTRIRYQTCNKQDCPSDFDFREQQCSEMDSHSFSDSFDIKIKDKRWLPKYGVPSGDECKLFCRLHKTVQYFLFKDKVKDGTPCTYESFNKCINGICHPAGCDNELYSDARLDKCGVCKGKNDTCQDIHGKFTHAQMRNSKSKYHHKVIRIPKGATNIEILQYGYPDDNNHIALVDESGQNILNGYQHLQPHKTIPYGGVILEYNGASSTIEKVNSTYAKRLKRDLLVEILALGQMRQVHENIMTYSYTISTTDGRTDRQYGAVSNHYYHQPPAVAPQPKTYYWKMSEWSECDQLCMGNHFRSASCVQSDSGVAVSPSLCRATVQPNTEYARCNDYCTLEWQPQRSECSEQCGEGTRHIKHNCIKRYTRHDHYELIDSSYCPAGSKPHTIYESCSGPCPDAAWSYGDWSPCTVTCGGGYQNRSIHCVTKPGSYKTIDNKYCENKRTDETSRKCNEDDCPEWTYGEDTPCSVTCGEGKRSTVIYCKLNNMIVNTALCGSVVPRPVAILTTCVMPPCEYKKYKKPVQPAYDFYGEQPRPETRESRNKDIYNIVTSSIVYEWRTGRWSECSVTCGPGGQKSRSVRCANMSSKDKELVDDTYCSMALKPVSVESCTHFRCPQWIMGRWGECNDDCRQYRQVICQDHRGKITDECPMDQKPNDQQSCCHFKWRTRWKPCSVSCGTGYRAREQVCMRLSRKSESNPQPVKSGKQVDNKYCAKMKQKTYKVQTKTCTRQCEFKWEVSPWSKCSAGCGTGFSIRNVTCTNGRVTSNSECDSKPRPLKTKSCDSRESCTFKIGKWRSCSCSGFEKRRIMCIDSLRNVQSNSCSEQKRPLQKRRCTPPPNCSCRDLQKQKHIRQDGEYKLLIRGREVSIYCAGMGTVEPKEYLTLQSGIGENFALYYNKRAKDGICNYRPGEMIDETIPYGTTRFRKIRISLDDLHVFEDDYQFADTVGRPQPFGSAGDCYSDMRDCPQGDFSINLKDTGFRMKPKQEWELQGTLAVMNYVIELKEPYQQVRARCGGYCGRCFASRNSTLQLDLV